MARKNTFDSFSFLDTASAKITTLADNLDKYLSNYFEKAKIYYSRKTIFGHIINFVKDLSNLIFYYVHKSATENNVITAQNDVSLAHFAQLSGHNVVRYISSKGSVRFHLQPNATSEIGNTLIVRKFAQLKCSANSLTYLVDIPDEHKIIALSKNDFVLPVIEGTVKEYSYISDGTALQTLHIEDTDNIEMYEMHVYVDGTEWEQVAGLTEMNLNSNSWIQRTGFINQLDIIFGDGIRGAIPPRGSQIRVVYLCSNGEFGNLQEGVDATFEPVDGFYDANSNEIDGFKEYVTVTKEAGFILGSYGDSKEVLRNIIGFNDRTLVLATDKNYEALISQFSTLSRVHVWSSPDNLVVKNLLVFPNISTLISNTRDYLTIDESKLVLSTEQKNALLSYIENSERNYCSNELRFVNPTIHKYAINVYVDKGTENVNLMKAAVEDACIKLFISSTFDKLKQNENLDIVKADIVKAIRNVLPNADSITVDVISAANEEAKINGFYYKRENFVLKSTITKIPVDENTDPYIGLSETNDIISDWLDILPLLRGGFNIWTGPNSEPKMIQDAVNVYVKNESSNIGWTKLDN